ncbi:BRIX1 [Branchiostoma lanceolatum]|uniref:Ribosome biogenesis protein BRX1 homolog n=1 Tax=Branchiostoma lanceolatum TaxID=7740 RepID=A0A8J9YYB8_BRALA|nr:BRIX1 [Branchiostoma lanceolatum]
MAAMGKKRGAVKQTDDQAVKKAKTENGEDGNSTKVQPTTQRTAMEDKRKKRRNERRKMQKKLKKQMQREGAPLPKPAETPEENPEESEDDDSEEEEQEAPAPVTREDPLPLHGGKWTNKQRCLVFCSRGVSYRARHLMNDLKMLMPHAKAESKMHKKENIQLINEMCEMKNCNKCVYLEARKKMDLYMWVSNVPHGPCVKFLVENVHTMGELKLTGNCLKGARPIVTFDKSFDEHPHWSLVKELFTQTFSTPYHHPKSQPFVDHVYTFSVVDDRIWFRNYQIVDEKGSLAEVGPRFVLNPIRMFGGSFGGPTLYQNPHYKSPNEIRRAMRRLKGDKYTNRVLAKKALQERKTDETYPIDPTDEVFATPRDEADSEDEKPSQKKNKRRRKKN